MHGVTKSITLVLKGGKESEFKGVKRVPFSTDVSLKRSDFGFDKNAIGPDRRRSTDLHRLRRDAQVRHCLNTRSRCRLVSVAWLADRCWLLVVLYATVVGLAMFDLPTCCRPHA